MLTSAIIFTSLTLFQTVFQISKGQSEAHLSGAHYYYCSDQFTNDRPLQFKVSMLSEISNENMAYFSQDNACQLIELQSGRMPKHECEILASGNSQVQLNQVVNGYTVTGIYRATDFVSEVYPHLPYLTIDPSYQTSMMHYFIHDTRIQDESSLNSAASLGGVSLSQVQINSDRISNDTIANYLQDTSTILIMFIIVASISILMSLVSIYNVLIVNDQDRRKEIGLLKSIGVTAKELKWMLLVELSIIGVAGALCGIVLGSVISSLVLITVSEKLKFVFSLTMIVQPLIILVSLIVGIFLMEVSGFLLYHHYFYTVPIQDLKGEAVQYDVPYNADRFSISTVTWRMFIIYNERIKKQSKNLCRSFLLVMLTITLFCGIWISNLMYQRNYQSVEKDFRLSPVTFLLGDRMMYEELDEALYHASASLQVETDQVIIDRSILGVQFRMPKESFSEYYLATASGTTTQKDGQNWFSAYHNGVVLDHYQLAELENYLVAGDLNSLDENSVVLIINQYGTYTSNTPLRAYQTGYQVLCENMDQSKSGPALLFDVDAIIALPFEKMTLQYSHVNDYLFSIAFTPESYPNLNTGQVTLKYDAEIKLHNPSQHLAMQNYLNEQLNQYDLTQTLELTDYIQIKNDGKFAVFLIEILVYPLLAMLVLIGVINVNNVLKGNIHMKRTDFATMKSVGMTSNQLRMVMLYEYLENYLNAGAITFVISIPLYLMEHFFSVASTFRIGDNFAGMFIMSFALISPVIIFSLAANSFRILRGITALDGMKDIE